MPTPGETAGHAPTTRTGRRDGWRLRFPCSRCVHLLCLPLLCVPALCAFVRCVVCLCSAHLHRVKLADPASPSTLATCHDLYPLPILSHICLLLSCHHALFLPLCPLSCLCCSFFLSHILLHTLSCSCLRLCLRKVAQVSLSAVELPGHLFVPALPSGCLVFFFATKKKTRGRVTVPPTTIPTRLDALDRCSPTSVPSDTPPWRSRILLHMHLPWPLLPTHLWPLHALVFNLLKTMQGHVVFGLDY